MDVVHLSGSGPSVCVRITHGPQRTASVFGVLQFRKEQIQIPFLSGIFETITIRNADTAVFQELGYDHEMSGV